MTTSKPTSPPSPLSNADRLLLGQGLFVGERLLSEDGRFSLTLQTDGNLVLHNPLKQTLWESGMANRPTWDFALQADGNLVMYDVIGNPIYDAGTKGKNGTQFILQSDGNAVLYDGNGNSIWDTQTNQVLNQSKPTQPDRLLPGQGLLPGDSIQSANGTKLSLTSDGNLVLADTGNTASWNSSTGSHQADICGAILQIDGNFVIYDIKRKPLWASNTQKNLASYLVVEDRRFVIYNSAPSGLHLDLDLSQ
jgi:hypothetical protein